MRQFLTVFAFCFFFVLQPALANQQPAKYCEGVESTADIMACMKVRHEAAQDALSALYEKGLSIAPLVEEEAQDVPSEAVSLRQAQKDWIVYRDQECAWQTGAVGEQSLKRVKELSCLAALTEQRIEILAAMLEEKDIGKLNQNNTALPRWMNALARDYPQKFWRYNDRLNADLDCDGVEEEIMVGLDLQGPVDASSTLNVLVAVSDNAMTGRPKATVFSFPLSAQAQPGGVCGADLRLSVVPIPDVLPVEGEQESRACALTLKIEDGICASHSVMWDGSAYRRFDDSQE